MNNLKIGDKCICIKSILGNEGKIAVVTGYFTETTTLDGVKWIKPDNFYSDLIVTSLGGLINCITTARDEMFGVKTRPVSSKNWKKLEDLDEREVKNIKIKEKV